VRAARLASIATSEVVSGIVEGAGEDSAPKSEGYISPGVDKRESFGEFSNLIVGDGVCVWVWADQDSILGKWRDGCLYIRTTKEDLF
jgi:hypothetical protein